MLVDVMDEQIVSSQRMQQEEQEEADTFVVTLRRESTRTPWGFLLDASDASGVHVCQLLEGRNAVSDYNKAARAEEQFRIFDFVVELNRTRLDSSCIGRELDPTASTDAKAVADAKSKLTYRLFTSLDAVMRLQRPFIFDAHIVRNSEKMGLNIAWTGHGASFGVISMLDEGAARRSTPPLLVGDRVIAVNGTRGGPDVLRRTLREAEDSITLTVSRRRGHPCVPDVRGGDIVARGLSPLM